MNGNRRIKTYGQLVGLLIFSLIYGIGDGAYQWIPDSLQKNGKNALFEVNQKETQSDVAEDIHIIFESLRDDTEYNVILLAGQSNMVGQGDVRDLSSEDQQLPQNIKYFNFGRGSNLSYNAYRFGPEVALSQKLNAYFPNKHFALIKYAVGGSSLLDWSPNWNPERAEITGNPHFGPLYERFLDKITRITKGKNVTFSALMWFQGERDARIPEAGKNYFENLSTLISHLRSELGTPNLPVLLGHVNPPPDRYPATKIVRDAQAKASQDLAHVYLVETDDLAKREDDLHYNTQGQLQLGKQFGRTLSKIISAQ